MLGPPVAAIRHEVVWLVSLGTTPATLIQQDGGLYGGRDGEGGSFITTTKNSCDLVSLASHRPTKTSPVAEDCRQFTSAAGFRYQILLGRLVPKCT